MKKAFTLIEVMISIVLLMIIIGFLYQSLDITEKSNKFFKEKLIKKQDTNRIKSIFFKDILYSIKENNKKEIKNLDIDKNKNTIFRIKSSNTYHDTFFQNITYLISKKNNLIRIESKQLFDKNKLNDEFFKNAFLDTIATGIEKFKIIEKDKNKYVIYLKFKDDIDTMFIVKSVR